MRTRSFWEDYKTNIMPKLEEIDIVLKTFEEALTIGKVSEILLISQEEISRILRDESIQIIDKESFLRIMQKGSSFICNIFRREVECGSPHIYSKENIAYIYDIPLEKIEYACRVLEIEIITSGVLPLVFDCIQ